MFLVVEEQDSTCSLNLANITLFESTWHVILTRNFRFVEYFPCKHFPVCPIKVVQYWSHAPRATINGTKEKSLVDLTKIIDNKKKKTKVVLEFFFTCKRKNHRQWEKIFFEKIIKTEFKLMKSKVTLWATKKSCTRYDILTADDLC